MSFIEDYSVQGRGTKIDRKTLTKIADKVVEYEPMLKKTSTMYIAISAGNGFQWLRSGTDRKTYQ